MLNLGLETFSHLVPGLHMFLPNKKKIKFGFLPWHIVDAG
jgi:hypothetical protein